MNRLISLIKIKFYNRMIDRYTKKIIQYNQKRETALTNKKHLIDTLEYDYSLGPERRTLEMNKANELAKIDSELCFIDETLSDFYDKKGSYDVLKRELKLSPVKK